MNIALTELIREQAFQCLVMTGAGIVFMMLYQLCSFLCRQIGPGPWVRWILEPVFWLGSALMTAQFLYYCAYGRVSVHSAAAFGAGVLLWKIFFCGIIDATHFQGNRIRGIRRHGKKEKEQSV